MGSGYADPRSLDWCLVKRLAQVEAHFGRLLRLHRNR